MTERTINYTCTEGSANKQYQLRLVAEGDGYRVLTQYGPIGGRQTAGEKTAGGPVPLAQAEKVFEKEHKARLAKGYRVVGDAPPELQAATTAVDSGARPQLLNAIDRADIEAYLLDPDWMMQIKFDGERVLIRRHEGRIEGINRKGQLRPLPIEVVSVIEDLRCGDGTLLDGELIGTTYCAFDLLALDGSDLRPLGALDRAHCLHALIGTEPSPIVLARCAQTSAEKRAMLSQAELDGEEGVVLKRMSASYTEARPNSGGPALKLKFTESATVRVAAINAGKRSVAMEVVDGTGAWIGVGNCTIPPNVPIPAQGSLFEARYLYYLGLGGALFQPVYAGPRHDIAPDECSINQLKHKRQDRAAA
jgi:bifunctional non-homologous end joining protein LigD